MPWIIAAAWSISGLKRKEGEVFDRTFTHSIIPTLALEVLMLLQQYV